MNQVKYALGYGRAISQTNLLKWFLVIAMILFSLFTVNAQQKGQHKIVGKVFQTVEKTKTAPLDLATVAIPDYAIGSYTDYDGDFALYNVPAGKVRLTVKYLGKVDIDTIIDVTRDLRLEFIMQDENFQLVNVVVTAENSKAGQSTSSKISRNAIDHLQATSLADIMSLLPGGLTQNQDLTYNKQANLRNINANTGGKQEFSAMNSFGTSIIKDGAPVSNNANLGTLNSAAIGATTSPLGGTNPFGGIDLRTISTDNIESVEIIRGIPSVQYGDLTAGAIIINSKAGREPLRVNVKANPNTYQFSAGSGFSLGKRKGALNINADYANNTSSIVQSYRIFERSNAKVLYSNKFLDNKLSSNTSLDLVYSRSRLKQNPDDAKYENESKGDNIGGTFNTNGIYQLNAGPLSNIIYVGSVSYTSKKGYDSGYTNSGIMSYSSTVIDGTVLSNRPSQHLNDKDGNPITNFTEADRYNSATMLPSRYKKRYDIEGKEISAYGKLAANFFQQIGRTNHKILVGAEFRTDGNEGKGKYFNANAVPGSGTKEISLRPRSYKDIPYVNQFSLFAQENLNYTVAERQLNITGGIRYDKFSSVSQVFSPRINASFEILPSTLTVRGGYGVTAKAPSMLFLRPEQAYFEYINLNELSNEVIPEADRLLITTTRVFDTENKNLKVAKNKKAEIGFDLKLGQALLYVTAFTEEMKNGYDLSTSLDTYRLIDYTEYKREGDDIVVKGVNPVFASYYTPTNNKVSKSKGLEFDLNLGRINAIRTSFSLNGMWIRSQSYDNDYTFYNPSSASGVQSSSHIAMYDKEMEKYNNERISTNLRVTHNIPEIGFVVTLTGQTIWKEADWYNFKNDVIPVKYISRYDGLVHDFDPAKANDPEFRPLLRSVNESYYIKESYGPLFSFNINVTKELGDYMRVSFFANNMFRSSPSIKSKRTVDGYIQSVPINKFFFGLELSVKI